MTQLCVITGCRVRGRHLPGCDDDQCGGCLPRIANEGLVCDVDVARTRERLGEIVDLAPTARLVAAGLVRRGGGGSSGKPESRPPLNDGATDALDEIRNTLTTWARHVAEERNGRAVAHAGDPIVHAARYLAANLAWMVHRAEVDEFAADVRESAGRMRGLVNGPSEQRYLGPCGAEIEVELDEEPGEVAVDECAGDVYARRGAASEHGWLFRGQGDDPPHQNTVGHHWRKTRRAAGLDQYDLHDLRHYYASGLIAEGCDVVTVQKALGHAKATTTLNTYAHLWPTAEDRTRKAADSMMAEVRAADQPRTTGSLKGA